VRRFRLGIRGKIAAVILLCMLPVLMLGAVLFQYRNRGRADVVERSHRGAARAIAADVEMFIMGAVQAERAAGVAVTSQPYPVTGIIQLFAAIRAHDSRFLSLLLIDLDGNVVASSPGPASNDAAADPSVAEVRRGRDWAAGPPVWSGRLPTVMVSSAVREGDRLTAIVAGRLDLEHLRSFLPRAQAMPLDGIVLDAGGRVLIDLRRANRDPGTFQTVAAVRQSLLGREATIQGYLDPATRTRFVGAAAPIPDLGWAAVVIEPESSALQSTRRAAVQELTIVVTAVGVGLFLAWVLGAELSAPILALARGARAIERGEIGTRVVLRRNDELGELGQAFNDMSARLARYIGEMNALQSVSDAALSTVRLDELLPPLVRQVVVALRADAGTIWFVDERSGDLLETPGDRASGGAAVRRLARGQGVAGRVAVTARSMTLGDPAQLAAIDPDLARDGALATVAVALRAGGKVIGVVQVSSRGRREFTSHDVRLLEAFADRVALAVDNAKTFGHEHELAEIIQRSLLPPAHVRLPGVTVAGRYLASHEVGGDFYAVLPLPDRRIGLAVADVTGKGIPAATLSARARYLLEAFAGEGREPDAVLARLNRVLAVDGEGKYMSLFYGVLDPRGGRLVFANAGHHPPLLLRAGSPAPTPLEVPGLLLGVDAGTSYETAEVDVRPGDLLLLFTDGVTEARNRDGKQFGEQGIAAVLQRFGHASPEELTDRVMEAVAAWSGPDPADDQTAVVAQLERTPAPAVTPGEPSRTRLSDPPKGRA
jgi:serine phosphatase RsbU (regulator of sigma subunit)/HAMP domain-containing protein